MTMPSLTLLGQSVIWGVFIGSLYGLLGLGLSLSWGLLKQINLSHFALAFLGAYLTYQFGSVMQIDPLLSLLLIVPIFFLVGVLMHIGMTKFKVTSLNSLLVTFGITSMIEAMIQWYWSADFRKLETHYADIKFKVGEFFFPLPEMMTLIASVALMCLAWSVLRYTDTGRAIRAAAEDGPIATAFGVNSTRLSAVLSGMAAATAGLAGVCIALMFTLAPSQIYSWIGVVFAVVMIGGLGNPWGPLLAGIVIGVSEALTQAIFSPAMAPLVSFSLLIIILLFRPGKA